MAFGYTSIRLHPAIEKLLAMVELPPGLVENVIARVQVRLANEALIGLSRPAAQARLELAACDTIRSTFQDYSPNRQLPSPKKWPWAHVVLVGERATVELWIGHDYTDEDGLEPFDVTVQSRHPHKASTQRVQHAAPAAVAPKHEPELQLRMKAPAHAATPTASKYKNMLDQRRK